MLFLFASCSLQKELEESASSSGNRCKKKDIKKGKVKFICTVCWCLDLQLTFPVKTESQYVLVAGRNLVVLFADAAVHIFHNNNLKEVISETWLSCFISIDIHSLWTTANYSISAENCLWHGTKPEAFAWVGENGQSVSH